MISSVSFVTPWITTSVREGLFATPTIRARTIVSPRPISPAFSHGVPELKSGTSTPPKLQHMLHRARVVSEVLRELVEARGGVLARRPGGLALRGELAARA